MIAPLRTQHTQEGWLVVLGHGEHNRLAGPFAQEPVAVQERSDADYIYTDLQIGETGAQLVTTYSGQQFLLLELN